MSAWISVKDELPKKSGLYLCRRQLTKDSLENEVVKVFYWSGVKMWGGFTKPYVSYWMKSTECNLETDEK